jgi:hypothetical protein
MKLGVLASIGHNLADSLGSGSSLAFNLWDIDVYRDAEQSAEKVLEVDFLRGTVLRGVAGASLAAGLSHAPQVLTSMCESHHVDPALIRGVTVCWSVERSTLGALRTFTVTVENERGRARTDKYYGVPGRRLTKGKFPSATAWL